MACATATSVASLPRGPRMDKPTGSPPTCAPGRLTCGKPARPPCAARQVMRARSGSRVARGRPRSGAGNGVVGRQRIAPGGQERGEPGAGLGAHQRGPLPLALGDRAAEREIAGHAERHTRVVPVDPFLEGEPRLPRLQGALGPRPGGEAGRRHDVLLDVFHEPGEATHHRLERAGRLLVGQAEAVLCDDEARGQRGRDRLAEHHRADPRERLRVAGEPAGGVGAGGLRQHAGEVEAAVGGADAVQAAEARRHPHRAAGVGPERGVAEALGDCRGRARGRSAGHAIGRVGIERRAVEGVLAQDAERDLVGDGLADQRRAGVEQALHRPGVPRRNRVLPRPVRVPAAGRMPRDVEEVLGRERQAGERAAGGAGDPYRRAGDEGGHGGHGDSGDSDAAAGAASSRACRTPVGYRARRKATRSCFSAAVSGMPSTRLKNSTVSSSVSSRPSCR